MRKVLLLGGDGKIGAFLGRSLGPHFDLICTSRRAGVDMFHFDLESFTAIELENFRDAEAVVFAIGVGGNQAVATNFSTAYFILVDRFRVLLEVLARFYTPPRFVLLSSSNVFPMSEGFASVNSIIRPTNAYGLIKANQEALVHQIYGAASIVRLGSFYESKPANWVTFTELETNIVASDLFTPTYGVTLAATLQNILNEPPISLTPSVVHAVSDLCVKQSEKAVSLPFLPELSSIIRSYKFSASVPCKTLI